MATRRPVWARARLRTLPLLLLLHAAAVGAQGAGAPRPAAPGVQPGLQGNDGPTGVSEPRLPAAGFGDSSPQPRQTADLTFGVTFQAGASDNFNLRPDGQEHSGRGLELTPYMEGQLRTARSRGDMALRLRGIWYSTEGDSHSAASPDLRANGDLSLADDTLRLAGSANVFRNSASPFSASSADPGSRAGSSDLYKAYAISPYSLGRLGGADYELRYRAQYIDPGDSDLRSTGQQIAAGLASSPGSSTLLGWSAHAETGRVDFEDDTGFKRTSAEALGYLGVSSRLRIGAGVNYAHIDVLKDRDGEDSGFGPTAFFSWRPGPRTWLTGKYADTYYGTESSLRLAHQGAGWVFGVSYLKGLQSGNESGLLYFDPNAIFALPGLGEDDGQVLRGMAQRRVLSGAGQPLLFGQTGNFLVFNESLVAAVGLLGPRNSALLTVFANEQEPAHTTLANGTSTDLSQRGASLYASHRLDPRNSVFLNPQYIASESDQTRQEARLAVITLGWQRILSRQTTFTASLRSARQSSAGDVPSAEYRERAVFVAIDHRF